VSPLWRSLRWGAALVFGAAVTTIVAGTAVAPFAVYHFHRMTHFGLIANMIVAPLVSVVIMPMALLGPDRHAVRAGGPTASRNGLGR
jgi:competence protein ComEC